MQQRVKRTLWIAAGLSTLIGAGCAGMMGPSDMMFFITSDHPWAVSWNSSHQSRGCSQENLRGTGGDGLLYCFAAK